MNNDDERDFEEERFNARLLREESEDFDFWICRDTDWVTDWGPHMGHYIRCSGGECGPVFEEDLPDWAVLYLWRERRLYVRRGEW